MRTKFHTLIPVLTILVAVGGIPHARGEDPNHSSAQESNPLDRLREYREKGELEKMLVYAEEQMRNYPYETEMIQDELVSGYEAHYQLYWTLDKMNGFWGRKRENGKTGQRKELDTVSFSTMADWINNSVL